MCDFILIENFVLKTTLPTAMAELCPKVIEPMEPVIEEDEGELRPATPPFSEVALDVPRESEEGNSPVETSGQLATPRQLDLTTGTVVLTQEPFALEFFNARDKKLVLKHQEISALMCLLPEAHEQMQALHKATAEGARHSDGIKWTRPISSGKNYRVDIEAGVYNSYAYLMIQPFFKQSALATPAEANTAPPGNDGRIFQYFQQLQKKKEETLDKNVWLRTASNFKLKTNEIDSLIGFVVENMF